MTITITENVRSDFMTVANQLRTDKGYDIGNGWNEVYDFEELLREGRSSIGGLSVLDPGKTKHGFLHLYKIVCKIGEINKREGTVAVNVYGRDYLEPIRESLEKISDTLSSDIKISLHSENPREEGQGFDG
jgi:hypothetical protein